MLLFSQFSFNHHCIELNICYYRMSVPNTTEDLSSEMEVDVFRRLFPLQYFERHLAESIRPDGRPLREARDTSIFLG
jgi:exosome complex component RRP43